MKDQVIQPSHKKLLKILIWPHSDIAKTQSVKDFIDLIINSSLSDDFEVEITLTDRVSKDMMTDVYYFLYRMGERVDFLTIADGMRDSPDCKLKEAILFKPTPLIERFEKHEFEVDNIYYRTFAFDSQASLHMCQANDQTTELMAEKIKEVMKKSTRQISKLKTIYRFFTGS